MLDWASLGADGAFLVVAFVFARALVRLRDRLTRLEALEEAREREEHD